MHYTRYHCMFQNRLFGGTAMTTIYLIRHAEAEGNLYRIAQGQHESILTDRGWRQVQALERRFEGVHIDAVYTSDLYRTCATASAICRPRDLKPIRRKDLREICVGDWEQRTWGEIYRRTPAQMADFSTHPERWYVEGAETPAQVRERMLAALQEIATENDGKTVAVFSHGYAIRMVLAALQGMTLAEAGTTPHGDNTAVSLLEASHGVLRVIWRDDNAHLQTPEFLAGEKVRRRATALEPGLWFVPLDLQAHGAFFEACAAEVWEDAGEKRPFSAQQLLGGVTRRTTLVGFRDEEPVGLVQMGPAPGWISLLAIRRAYRGRGFGVQLIGQAVQLARGRGAQTVRIAPPEEAAARTFLADYGFAPAETAAADRTVLEKDIAFRKEFLGD